jgi:cytoskeletal protein CcmA (bactofilin family)
MKKVLLACLLTLLLVASATPVFADGDDGKVVFGGSFTLESGEELDGDLVVFGGSAVLEEDSRVDGDVVVMGGNASVAGEVDGDVVTFGGNVEIRATAVVDGNLVTIGGNVDQDSRAIVRGGEVEGLEFEGFPRFWTFPTKVSFNRWPNVWFRFMFDIFKTIFVALAFAALGLLIVLFWPKQTEVVGQAVLAAPLPSGGVGLLTAVVAAALMVLLAITICLSPVAFLLGVAMLVAGIFGWTAVGLLVGQRLLGAFKVKGFTPLIAVAVGVLLVSLLSAVPCLGTLLAIVVGWAGLGAVVLTRFGTQAYPLPKPVPPAPPASVEPEEVLVEEVEFKAEEAVPEAEEAEPEEVEPEAEEVEPGPETEGGEHEAQEEGASES